MGRPKTDCEWRFLPAPVRPAVVLLMLVPFLGCEGPDSSDSAPSGQSASPTSAASDPNTTPIADRKVWDITYMEGQQVGHGSTSITNRTRDGKQVLEIEGYSQIALKRFGQTFKMETRFSSVETPSGQLVEFTGEMPQGAAPMKSSGRVVGDSLELTISGGGKPLEQKIPWKDEYGGPYAVELSLLARPMKPGEKRSISNFDIGVGMLSATQLEALDYEEVELRGGPQELLKINSTMDLGGQTVKATSWANRSGEVLRTRMNAMGLDLDVVRVSEEEALAGTKISSFDLGTDVMVPVKNRSVTDPHATSRIVYRLRIKDGDPSRAFASGYSQSVEPIDADTAKVTVWAVRPGLEWGNPNAQPDPPTEDDRAPNLLIESDDPLIVKMSREAAGGEKDPWKASLAMESYVSGHMTRKGFSKAFDTAATVAKSRSGDCTEHAVLLAAMARAAGIPARVAIGLVYYQKSYAYHMWTEVHVEGRWIPLDATLGRGGIGAAHLKVTHSNLKGASPYAGFLPVLNIVGQLEIEIEDIKR